MCLPINKVYCIHDSSMKFENLSTIVSSKKKYLDTLHKLPQTTVVSDAGADGLIRFKFFVKHMEYVHPLGSWLTQTSVDIFLRLCISMMTSWRMPAPATLHTSSPATSRPAHSTNLAQWTWTPHLDCRLTRLDLQVLTQIHSHRGSQRALLHLTNIMM